MKKTSTNSHELTRRGFNKLMAAALIASSVPNALAGQQRNRKSIQAEERSGSFKVLQKGRRGSRTNHSIPPIIVDSGSLEIKLPAELGNPSNISGNQRRKFRYMLPSGVPLMKAARVWLFHEFSNVTQFNDPYSDTGGIRIHLWLQKVNGEGDNATWDPNDIVGDEDPHVVIGGHPIAVEIDKRFKDHIDKSKHGKEKKERVKYKHEDNDNQNRVFRIGRVDIRQNNGRWVSYTAGDNQLFVVKMWDHID